MKKIIIVNNNLKIGGVQKALCELLSAIEHEYDITLLLFAKRGELIDKIPPSVKVIESGGMFRLLGVSQGECRGIDALLRGVLALCVRLFGRHRVIHAMLKWQPRCEGHYDCAISYLHNGRKKSFYGGVQDYVLGCIDADKKIAFLHGDYMRCGANHVENDCMMAKFDAIATCSEGCRRSFLTALPHLDAKCKTVYNCHNFDEIRRLADLDTVQYDDTFVHAVSIARLSHEKGLERAIAALSYAREHGQRVILHIVGDGPMKNTLVALTQEKGLSDNVIFYGEQSNPYRYIKHADLLLMSSYHEAAPMVIDEACALGVPTLTTDTISSKEKVLDRGCGWVCDNEETALCETFLDVVSDREALQGVKEKLRLCAMDNDMAIAQFGALIADNDA